MKGLRPHQGLQVACLTVLLLIAPGSEALAELCAGEDGRLPVTRAGQERALSSLLQPHAPGAALVGGPAGWSIGSVSLEQQAAVIDLSGPATATIRLAPAMCPSDSVERSASFAATIQGTTPEAEEAARAVWGAIQDNDQGTFWVAFVEPEPTVEEAARELARERSVSRTGIWDLPLHRSNTGLAMVLFLALLALLIDSPGLLRDMGLGRDGRPKVFLALSALTVTAWGVRWGADPTFIREAHCLMHIPVGDHIRLLGMPHEPYPQGPQLMFQGLRALLPQDTWDAWFAFDVLLGALTVPVAFLVGSAVGQGPSQRRMMGLVAAALVAFWPQHIRVSASESVHVAVCLWATVALATTLVAARSGAITALVAAVLSTGALLTTRPESALWVPGLLVIGLGAGDGIRRNLKHPLVLTAIALVTWLILPMLMQVGGTSQAARLAPGSSTPEAVTLGSLVEAMALVVDTGGANAFFDLATTPVWLWPAGLWGAVVLWRSGQRAMTVGLLLVIFATLTVTVRLGASGVMWPMARYHLTAFPALVPLTLVGLWSLAGRLPPLEDATRRGAALIAIAALGCGLWWPAMGATPMDWQREHHWLQELSRSEPPVLGPGVRLVTPDNRRAFLDMGPRSVITPLTLGQQSSESAVSVAEALEKLHVSGTEPEALFYRGLYCYLAVHPDGSEGENPQCQAMAETFELEPIQTLTIDEPTYLEAYREHRRPGPLELGLYRIGKRHLAPEEALRRLPEPIAKGQADAPFPMASGARRQIGPAHPRLSAPKL